MSDLVDRPQQYETSPHYRMGYGASAICDAIRAIDAALTSSPLLHIANVTGADLRNLEIDRVRRGLELAHSGLTAALDVLDPAGLVAGRQRITSARFTPAKGES